MEETIDALIADMQDAEKEAAAHGVGAPKAIYVCKTNIVEGNSLQMDDPKQPFAAAALAADPHLALPDRALRRGPGRDRGLLLAEDAQGLPACRRTSGSSREATRTTRSSSPADFRHVIFNLSLQEGWDDPLAYFAYIDKSMESNIQVEQIVGRLLRQPGAAALPRGAAELGPLLHPRRQTRRLQRHPREGQQEARHGRAGDQDRRDQARQAEARAAAAEGREEDLRDGLHHRPGDRADRRAHRQPDRLPERRRLEHPERRRPHDDPAPSRRGLRRRSSSGRSSSTPTWSWRAGCSSAR